MTEGKAPPEPAAKKKEKESDMFFDVTATFNRSKEEFEGFWDKVVTSDPSRIIKPPKEKVPNDTSKKDDGSGLSGLKDSFLQLVTGSGQKAAIQDLVASARQSTEQGHAKDTTTITEILAIMNQYQDSIHKVTGQFLGAVAFSPTSLFYYQEMEDEIKNPSWKRRVHRFCPDVGVDRIAALNDALDLALLSYADTVEEVREGLANHRTPCELVYADARSEPGQPANFVAVRRDQSSWSSTLEIVMLVRGTKTVADAVTDLLCDSVDYRDGQAHSFILNSGKYLAEKHTKMLEELLEKSGKSSLTLTLIGHSLGAGAASIAGMELNDNPKFKVEVIGFGCPPLLSKDLAAQADYITTVINDSDAVPRVSGISLSNFLRNVSEFDWLPYAERDVNAAFDELKERQPFLFNDAVAKKVQDLINPMLEDFAKSTIEEDATEERDPVLYPPGKCAHFYRDGRGISGSFVPNTFFDEIEVSRRMLDDHLIRKGYQATFLQLMREYKADHHFRFDDDEKKN